MGPFSRNVEGYRSVKKLRKPIRYANSDLFTVRLHVMQRAI